MEFNQNNTVMQLCAQGMQMEGEGKLHEAKQLFCKAWDAAVTPIEQFTAAHYVARHQNSVEGKLVWDEKCLSIALTIDDEGMKANYPSLYLNIGKCYEDMQNPGAAGKNYALALSYISYLPGNGYGNMIKAGIEKGIERIKVMQKNNRL
jgi:rifampin ADP-ribosylating transferase